MRKTLAIILGAMLMLSGAMMMAGNGTQGADVPVEPRFAGGMGFVGNPYLIANLSHLQEMNTALWANFTLINDIDASETQNWNGNQGFVPIGNDLTPFLGKLNGNGFTVSGLHINRPGNDNVGLIGYMDTVAYVGNITIDDVSITGNNNTGGLVGNVHGGTVSKSCTSGSITGGLYIGGLVGYINSGTITGTYSTVDITGDSIVGGLLGYNYNGILSNSYASGNVNGTGNIGGLLGYNAETVSRCYASGNVTGVTYIGGLVGCSDSGTETNTYATGNVEGNTYVGGLMGRNQNGVIFNSYSTGNVTGFTYLGALVGSNEDTVTNSYWDSVTSGIATGTAGAPRTTVQLMTQATYATWDFTTVWWMIAGNTRPFLRMEWSNQINNSHQLQMMNMDLSKDYCVMCNFNLDDVTDPSQMWGTSPTVGSGFYYIGNPSAFMGDLDGQGHTIAGLFINRVGIDKVGLFGYAGNTCVLSNLTLEDVEITGRDSVGGLVGGFCQASVINISVSGSVTGNAKVGGLVADLEMSGMVSNSNTNVITTGTSETGGLVGYKANTCPVSNSYAKGDVIGGDYTGGLIGSGSNSVTNSYASGNVSGNDYVGGVMGFLIGTMTNCYAKGNISGTTYVGGLLGNNIGTVSNSYSVGNVSGASDVGGLVGTNTGTVSNCFWDNQTSGRSISAGGTGKDTTEMMDAGTFQGAGWDFSVWAIKDTFTYPFFGRDLWNDVPTGVDDYYFISEDVILSLPAKGLLANDWDKDESIFPGTYRDTLTVSAFDNLSLWGASVSVNPDGGFSYNPTGVPIFQTRGVGEFLMDSFSYTVTDGKVVDTATVIIRVNGTNDLPTAFDDYDTLNEDFPILILPNGVLVNDVDADINDILTVIANDFATVNGATVTLNAGGGFVYDPSNSATIQALAMGEYLNDSFTYVLTDGNGGMDIGAVYLNVTGINDAPVITSTNSIQGVEGQAYFVDYDGSDIDINDSLTWSLATNATWLGINATSGVLAGTPEVGVYNVNVNLADSNGGIDWTNFTLTVLADADGDGTPDYIDPDFLATIQYNNQTVNQTVWNNQTVNQTVNTNSTVWQNSTNNVTIGVSDADSDGDGWTDAEEILAGTDPLDATDMPADTDGDGIADFMDPEEAGTPDTTTVTETPMWAWAAVIAAVAMGAVAMAMAMRKPGGKKPEEADQMQESSDQKPNP